jgi:acyl-CoA dehydrogenase
MDFSTDADHLAIVDAVDRVCATFDDTYWLECDQRHEFPWAFYSAMAEGGWLGVAIPEEYGGGGRGVAECAIVLNRVAASGAAMNGSSVLHLTMFGLNPVVKFGDERLKRTFLPRAATGDLHVAFGMSCNYIAQQVLGLPRSY